MNVKLTDDEREALEMLVEHDGDIASMPFLLAVGDDVAGSLVRMRLVAKSTRRFSITDAGRLALAQGQRND